MFTSFIVALNAVLPFVLYMSIGTTVDLLDLEFNEEVEFKIVGSTEADSLQGLISNEAPVGKALLGKRIGDLVNVETQMGNVQYKVLNITRS